MRCMSSLLAAPALALALAASPADAEDAPAPAISSVVIEADIAAIGSREAVSYWQNLPRDLEAAILRELFDLIGADGATLRVAIDHIALAEAFETEFEGPNARLAGQVQLLDAEGEPLTGAWEVAASAGEAEALLPPDVEVEVISRTDAEFYEAVVNAFARGVAQVVENEMPDTR
jgi:hypothetical protein